MRRFPRLICATATDHGDLYIYNRPGTLCYRSTFCQQYNPKVLNDDWYEFQMSQPLDYDYIKDKNRKRSFQRSSYRNFWFGDPKAPLPKSTTHAMMEEALDWWGKKKLVRLPYLNEDNFDQKTPTEKGLPQKLPSLKTTSSMAEEHPTSDSAASNFKFPHHIRKPLEPITANVPDTQQTNYHPLHSHSTSLIGQNHKGVHTWQDLKHSPCRCQLQEPSTDIILHPEDPRFNK